MESTTDFEKLLFLYKTEGKNRNRGNKGFCFSKNKIRNIEVKSRQSRQSSGMGICHVMMRRINHQNIFENLEDYYQFLNTLGMMAQLYIHQNPVKAGCCISIQRESCDDKE